MKKEIFSFTLAILAIVFGVACDTDQPNPNPTTSSDVVANTDTGPQPAKCDGLHCETDAGPSEPDTSDEPDIDNPDPPVCEIPMMYIDRYWQCGTIRCRIEWSLDHCTGTCPNGFYNETLDVILDVCE